MTKTAGWAQLVRELAALKMASESRTAFYRFIHGSEIAERA